MPSNRGMERENFVYTKIKFSSMKKEVPSSAGKWIQLEIVVARDLSTSQRDKYPMLSPVCGSLSLQINLYMYRCHGIEAKLFRAKGTNMQREKETVGEGRMSQVHWRLERQWPSAAMCHSKCLWHGCSGFRLLKSSPEHKASPAVESGVRDSSPLTPYGDSGGLLSTLGLSVSSHKMRQLVQTLSNLPLG